MDSGKSNIGKYISFFYFLKLKITLCNTKFVYCIFFIDLDVFFAADFENAIIFSLSSVLF